MKVSQKISTYTAVESCKNKNVTKSPFLFGTAQWRYENAYEGVRGHKK